MGGSSGICWRLVSDHASCVSGADRRGRREAAHGSEPQRPVRDGHAPLAQDADDEAARASHGAAARPRQQGQRVSHVSRVEFAVRATQLLSVCMYSVV